MKIRKYQAGSIIYTPTPRQDAAASTQSGTSSSSASEETKKIDPFLKEIMEIMKQKGLPSDVDKILKTASSYLDKSSRLTDMSIFGGEQDYDIKDYIKILSLVKKAEYNEGLYEDAAKNITKEGAWDNIAVDTNGKIWTEGEGGIGKISLEQYIKERDNAIKNNIPLKYKALTNNELAEYRTRYFGFDSSGMLEDLQNVKGIESISKHLVDVVTKFKEKGYSYYKYSKNSDIIQDGSGKSYNIDDIKDGLEALTSSGPSGYYKITKKSGIDTQNVESALNYLWNSMDSSMKNTLKAQMAVDGANPNIKRDINNFLLNIIANHTGDMVDVDFDSSATNYDPNGTGKKGGSSTESKVAQDYISRFATLDLPTAGYDTIVPNAAKIADSGAMLVKTLNGGLVRDQKTKEGLKDVTIDELLSRAEFAQSVDQSNISFGNKSLNQTDLKKIAFQGGEVNVAMLPYKQDPTTGKIVPDFDSLNAFNQIQEILNEKGIINEFRLAEECKKRGLDYNSINHDKKTNTITFKNTMAFAYVTGLAGDKTIDLSDDNKRMLEKIEGEDRSDFADIYNRIITYNELGINKSSKKYNKFSSSNKNHIYEGRVYFAMPNAQRGLLMSSNGQYRDKSDFTDFIAKGQVNDYEVAKIRQIQENDPDYDYKAQTLGKF